jgi:hypothetical protein
MGTTHPSKLTSPSSEFSPLNWRLIYSVLVLLNLKLFDSKGYLHNSSFWSTPILFSSISTTSSAKSIHQGVFPYMSFMISSITNVKIYWLNADPWCNSILIGNISAVTCSDTSHNICIHILNKSNVLCWDSFLFKHPLHDISWYFIIRFLQINKYHM